MKRVMKKSAVYLLLVAAAISITACSSGDQYVPSTPTATPTPSAAVTPTPTPAPTSTNHVPSNSSTPVPTVKPSPIPSKDAASINDQIKEMFELAKSGKVAGIEFAARTGLIDDVEKAWGKADKKENANGGIYATYSKRNAVFGVNKGSQIFDVRSNDPKLQKLTLAQIEQVLGKPADTKVNGDDTIYIYNASPTFQLKYVIPKSTGKVDHISVFDPKDAVNNMAG